MDGWNESFESNSRLNKESERLRNEIIEKDEGGKPVMDKVDAAILRLSIHVKKMAKEKLRKEGGINIPEGVRLIRRPRKR